MMSIIEDIEKEFNKNDIKYFKGGDKLDPVLNVPYRGIDNPKNHINIYVSTDEELKIVKFTFLERANKNIAIEIIREKILDLNSHLYFGTLSMRSDSNTIEYRIDYQLNDAIFSFKKYNIFIIRCVETYELMQKEDII